MISLSRVVLLSSVKRPLHLPTKPTIQLTPVMRLDLFKYYGNLTGSETSSSNSSLACDFLAWEAAVPRANSQK